MNLSTHKRTELNAYDVTGYGYSKSIVDLFTEAAFVVLTAISNDLRVSVTVMIDFC